MVYVTIMRSNGETEEALGPQGNDCANALAPFNDLAVETAIAAIANAEENSAIRRLGLALSDVAARVERRQRHPASELAQHDLASMTVKVEAE